MNSRCLKACLLNIVSHIVIYTFPAVVGFKCPTKVPSNSAAAKFWPYPRFAVPGDCGRLITCVNGFPRLIACGEGKVFDDSTLTCEEPELVPQCANHLRK